jgi:hypothetical protein
MTARNTGARPVSACALAMHHSCVRSNVQQPNHALSGDGTWSHGSVAARPTKWQRETPASGDSPFPRGHLLCTVHVLSEGVCSYARMLAPAKARIRRDWDLVSLIGRIKTHGMTARKLGLISISARVLAMHCACQEGMQFSNQSCDA